MYNRTTSSPAWALGDTIRLPSKILFQGHLQWQCGRWDDHWADGVQLARVISAFPFADLTPVVLQALPPGMADTCPPDFHPAPDCPVYCLRCLDGELRHVIEGNPLSFLQAENLGRRIANFKSPPLRRDLERRDPPFDHWRLRLPGLLEGHERKAWQRCIAARRAGHLRLLAQRLRERERIGAPPVEAKWLRPLFIGQPVSLPAWMLVSGSVVARPLVPHQPPKGYQRLAHHRSRRYAWKPPSTHLQGLTPAVGPFASDIFKRPMLWIQPYERERTGLCGTGDLRQSPYLTLRGVAAARADLRWRLQGDSAPVLEAVAEHLESVHDLPLQPAVWFTRPSGWLHGVARDLARLLFGRKAGAIKHHSWHGNAPLQLDLLAPLAHPDEADWPTDVRAALQVIRTRLNAHAQQRGTAWTEARLVVGDRFDRCEMDDTWCRWTLETHTPFLRLDSWMSDTSAITGLPGSDADWLPFHHWPDASPDQRGPEAEHGRYYSPSRVMLRWRSRAYARTHG